MKKLSLLALLVLGGCFATSESVFLPDGSTGYRLSCNVGINDIADCMEKAGELCGVNGYTTFDQSGHARTDAEQQQIVIAALNGGTRGYAKTSDNQKFMLVKCKNNDPPTHLTPAPMPQVDNKPIPLENASPMPPSSPPAKK